MSRANSPNSEINLTTGEKDLIGKNNVQILLLKQDVAKLKRQLVKIGRDLGQRFDSVFERLDADLERIDKDHRDIINRIINLEKGHSEVDKAVVDLIESPSGVARGPRRSKLRQTRKKSRN